MLLIFDIVFVVRSLFFSILQLKHEALIWQKRLIFRNDTSRCEMNYTQNILRAINRRMYLSSISMVLHE